MKNLSTFVFIYLFFYSPSFSQTCIPDQLIFNTQSEIDSFSVNYPGCTEVLGDLKIVSPFEITDLTGLSQLEKIGGVLGISITHNLETLSGLENLTTVEGGVLISSVESLNDLSALNNLTSVGNFAVINTSVKNFLGLGNLTIEGTLRIEGNDSLLSLAGLESIIAIPEDLLIYDNNLLTDLTGLENLTSVGNNLWFDFNDSLVNLDGLENLNHIGSSLYLQHNYALSDISGLMNLSSIGDACRINSTKLTSLSGLENLTLIGGYLHIYDNSELVDLSSLINLTDVGHGIHIKENDLLSNLNGLENIGVSTLEVLSLIGNPMLSVCNEVNICNYISIGGTTEINGNNTGCNSIAEIDSLCNLNFSKVVSKVYFDLNQNKIMDIDEVYFPDANLYINPIDLNIFSTQNEETLVYLNEGSYEIGLNQSVIPNWTLTTDSSIYQVLIDTTNTCDTISFGLYPTAQISKIISFITSPPARCGESKTFQVHAKNIGTTIMDGIIWMEIDENIVSTNYITFPDTIVTPNLIGWFFENLYPNHTITKKIRLGIPTPPNIVLGDVIHTESYVEYFDANGGNSSSLHEYNAPVFCSFDPNDKLVSPSRNNNLTLFEEDLMYTIRFQNTGNDEAYDIIIRDTLDENLDPTTFRFLSTSHPNVLITTMEADQFLTFNFEDIYLPDSTTNFDASQGYVSYLISPKEGLAEETLIKNTASIYFDFNPPIVTNTTESVMVSELPTSIHNLGGEEGMKIEIFPNPVSDHIFIKKEKTETLEYQITDVNGRLLRSGELIYETSNITFTKMNSGIYFIKIINPTTREHIVEKIVK